MEETEYVIKTIKFGILSPEHIKKMSVVTITVPDTYDEEWVPIPFGLMDRRLGTLEPLQRCETCGERMEQCPGHFGRIELARPVIHIGFIKYITMILQTTCSECGRILLDDNSIRRYKDYYLRFKNKNCIILQH
jgi:DNA-directed RNA polymerase, beta'' subunit/160 kD subunit